MKERQLRVLSEGGAGLFVEEVEVAGVEDEAEEADSDKTHVTDTRIVFGLWRPNGAS